MQLCSAAAVYRDFFLKPLIPDKTISFWNMVIKNAGVKTVDALKAIEPKTLYYAWLNACKASKFSMPYTFPVYDGTILQKGKFTAETITDIPYIIGSTCTDMLPIVLQAIHKKWGKYAKSITETNVTSITSQDICRAIIKEHGIQQICFMLFQHLILIGVRLSRLIMKYPISFHRQYVHLLKWKSELQCHSEMAAGL